MSASKSVKDKSWIVVWTMPRAEKKVAARIAAHGIEVWLPTRTERHRWSDRWREVVLPLFPGYLFARCCVSQLHTMLRTEGVLTVVKSGDKPAQLTDAYVACLRSAIECADYVIEPVTSPETYNVDDEVIVQEGPLAGLRGVVRQLRGAQQLVIWIQAIGRGIAFTIASTLVSRPISSSKMAATR